MSRRVFIVLATIAVALIGGIASASAQALIEETTFLDVQIDGRPYRLEALIVKPAGASGRLPIALLTHGRNGLAEENAKKRARGLLPQARDFAHRGWLAVSVVRRGFGLSDGPEARGVDCVHQTFRENFERNADDLAAALTAIAQRPDADPHRVVAVGVSAGGAAALALAARRPPGLVGVINVSGGLQVSRNGVPCSIERGLISAFANFGARSRVPTLWLYAQNDSLFAPSLVTALHEAYRRAGGIAELALFAPLSDDGHKLWSMFEGRKQWLPRLDQFLIAQALPTWDRAALEARMATSRLGSSARPVIEGYLAAPTEKVLAVSQSTHRLFWWAGGELAAMRQKSLDACEQKTSEPCAVVLENFAPTGNAPQASVH